MHLEIFTEKDIPAASALTYKTWGGEMQLHDTALESFIYEAMVRYYFRGEGLSLKLQEQSEMLGFLLAAPVGVQAHLEPWFAAQAEVVDAAGKKLAQNYLAYLAFNGHKVTALAHPDEALLCLCVSTAHGGGSKLLAAVEERARSSHAPQVHLWADATCNYDYYRHRGYSESAYFVNKVLPQLGAQQTWVYSKKL